MSFSALKISLMVGLPWLGYGVLGAVGGFAAASVLILLAAWLVIGRSAVKDRVAGATPLTILKFELLVIGHVAVTNLLMQMDLLMIKGLFPGDASTAAAMYGSASKLAQIPYSLLVALNFLIFPLIARATSQARPEEAAGYIRQAIRVGAALTIGPALVLAAVSPSAVAVVFGPGYQGAAPPLTILAFGYIAFSLLSLMATILNGAGRPLASLAIAVGTLAVQVALARLLIPEFGLSGGAAASSGAYLAGLVAALAYVIARFGNILPWATLARIALAGAAVLLVPNRFSDGWSVIVVAPALGTLYVLILILLREWSVTDLHAVTGRIPARENAKH